MIRNPADREQPSPMDRLADAVVRIADLEAEITRLRTDADAVLRAELATANAHHAVDRARILHLEQLLERARDAEHHCGAEHTGFGHLEGRPDPVWPEDSPPGPVRPADTPPRPEPTQIQVTITDPVAASGRAMDVMARVFAATRARQETR